ncbi:MAG: hypothetical protein KBG85_15295 [Micropruina sp.]|nr:hypothetical protein [Micropruina sp.]
MGIWARLTGRSAKPSRPLTREEEERLRIEEQRAEWRRKALDERRRFGRY